MGIPIDNISNAQAIEAVTELIRSEKKSSIYFLNSDCLYKALTVHEYMLLLRSKADLLLCDGIGLKFVLRIFKHKMIANNNGTDFSPFIMKIAKEHKKKIFLLGGYPGVASEAGKKFCEMIPGLEIVDTNDGYFKDDNEIIKKINESGADILLVGFGAPKQELWIDKNRQQLNPRICIGVGALFDYNSGRIPRAPFLFRQMNLEWLWRVLKEPKRLTKRYFLDSFLLLFIIIKYKFRNIEKLRSMF